MKELHRIRCLPNISVLPFIIEFYILPQLVNIFLSLACLIDSDLHRIFCACSAKKECERDIYRLTSSCCSAVQKVSLAKTPHQ